MNYILSWNTIETIATEVLKEYQPECLHTPQGIDVYDFMENFLLLDSDYQNLSPDQSILGLTSFCDGIYYVWNDTLTEQYPIIVKDRTVILENSLLDGSCEGRERFTVMHECSHQILHREHYKKTIHKSNSGLVACAKRDIEPTKRKRLQTSNDWFEWQANALAAALLMPTEMVKKVYSDIVQIGLITSDLPWLINLGLDSIIFGVADVFKVSYTAMKIRLEQLGLIENNDRDNEAEIAIL